MEFSPYLSRVFTLSLGSFLPTLTKSCWQFRVSWSSQGRHKSAWCVIALVRVEVMYLFTFEQIFTELFAQLKGNISEGTFATAELLEVLKSITFLYRTAKIWFGGYRWR